MLPQRREASRSPSPSPAPDKDKLALVSPRVLLRVELELKLGLGLKPAVTLAAALILGSSSSPPFGWKVFVGLGRNRGDVISLHPSGVESTILESPGRVALGDQRCSWHAPWGMRTTVRGRVVAAHTRHLRFFLSSFSSSQSLGSTAGMFTEESDSRFEGSPSVPVPVPEMASGILRCDRESCAPAGAQESRDDRPC